MPQDKEQEIRLQFLEEAQEYLNLIESSLIGLSSTTTIDRQSIDGALRAAHSIKGGAAMMEFQTLSFLAHRLEDFFKVLKTQTQPVEPKMEMLLLTGVDCLRSVVEFDHQNQAIDQQWLETKVKPVYEQIEQQLGAPDSQDISTMSLPEEGQDNAMLVTIFETEVEESLQRLEAILGNSELSSLVAEVQTLAQELSDLSAMFEIDALQSLSADVTQQLTATPDRAPEIAAQAVQAWRRSQAAILVGQTETLPTQLNRDNSPAPTTAEIDNVPISLTDSVTDLRSNRADNSSLTANSSTELAELKQDLVPTNNFLESQENTVRVPLKQLEQLNDLFGELTIERNGITLYLERLRNSVRILERRTRTVQQSYLQMQTACEKAVRQEGRSRRQERDKSQDPPSISPSPHHQVTVAEENDFHLLAQEVMQNLMQLQEVVDDVDLVLKDADQTASEMNWTAKQLQTCITQLRMRPLSDLLGRFPRALRELALTYGKQVELKIQGGSTLVDRSILETLSDPLMHLLRNAFDHGIEDPATRKARGKPEKGTIEIKAAHRGNQTLISFSDDGSGIELNKIRLRAHQLGLDPVAIAKASDAELLTLIFEPGFSTANEVTTLSGRGVGMDVVRTNLRQIRGDIQVDTQPGKGTTFTLSVPLTLSVGRVVLVESKGMLLAFPTDAIAEMVLLNSEQLLTAAGKAVLNWKGQMIALIRLSDWLKFRHPRFSADTDTVPMMNAPTVLLIAQGDEWVGLQVDRCWGEQEVAIRQIEGLNLPGGGQGGIAMPPGFTGCTILGDGRVVPLVNALELLHWIASCQQAQTLELEAQPQTSAVAATQKHTILLVDDSVNVRRFLSLNLEKAGYQVEQANNGQDALEKILNGLQPEVVICDVDMPHLDGYGLLSRLKSNPDFQHLPIVMLTSRSSDKERQLARNLGASAFFSKPYNKQELLQTLEQLIQAHMP